MANLRVTYVVVAGFATVITWGAQKDLDGFEQLKNEGMYDPSVSSELVNSMLREGIASTDSRVGSLTL